MLGSVEENQKYYALYDWSINGDEWSWYWGSAESMWTHSIYPRIKNYLPAANIVEIGCGHGRLSGYLKPYCSETLYLLDIMDSCVSNCSKKFKDDDKTVVQKTDGTQLTGVPDKGIDLVVSYYSLVGANRAVMNAYVDEIARVLTPTGNAFIHHSNAGMYYDELRKLEKNMQLLGTYRDCSIDAKSMKQLVESSGLICTSQEMVNWDIGELLSDCFTVISRSGLPDESMREPVANFDFVQEMSAVREGQSELES